MSSTWICLQIQFFKSYQMFWTKSPKNNIVNIKIILSADWTNIWWTKLLERTSRMKKSANAQTIHLIPAPANDDVKFKIWGLILLGLKKPILNSIH